VNIKAFFVDALTAALDLKIGTPDDVLRHVTPEVLAHNLPRPLWARLLTACLGAPKVDARLVVETIGLPNLCEHIPSSLIWSCIADIGARSLGKEAGAPVSSIKATSSGRAVLAPPPEPVAASSASNSVGSSTPAPTPSIESVLGDLEQSDASRDVRPRTATNRFRQSSTGVARGIGNVRRPQAVAATPPPTTLPRPTGGRNRSSDTIGESE